MEPRVGGPAATQPIQVRGGVWHDDQLCSLELPAEWDVEVCWPRTPAPLTDSEIEAALRQPVGQPPIATLARDRSRPVIVVDDPTRPTPASRVLPFVLRQLEEAGARPEDVTIVMATGTHGPPHPDGMANKIGPEAASRCRLVIHDHHKNVVPVGRTRFGTPVLVDREVARADFLIGIGGVYPQHSHWFGGGSKLMLGVLGERSIANLHYRHWTLPDRYQLTNEMRQDLDEVARLVRLQTSVLAHLDASREIVRISAGDPLGQYEEAARFSADAYRAPHPAQADVVVANAYPMDLSLEFAISKGTIPLRYARPGASRVLLASCQEGTGHHGLFPLITPPRHHYRRERMRRLLINRSEIPGKVMGRISRMAGARAAHSGGGGGDDAPAAPSGPRHPIHLFRPLASGPPLPAAGGVQFASTWAELLARVAAEQGDRPIRALVYPCAPLQVLDL